MQSVVLKVAGLYSFPNRLSSIPTGALLKATNIVINRDNVAESRRGFKLYGNAMGVGSTTTAHQLLNYKGRILRHFGTGDGTTLEVDSDGAGVFTPFNVIITGTTTNLSVNVTSIASTSQLVPGMFVTGVGIAGGTTVVSITSNTELVLSAAATATGATPLTFTWNIAEVATGLRIKFIEQNSNLYLTSSKGIQKISASNTTDLSTAVITAAGGIKALDIEATLNPQIGFFNQESIIGYRLVWGIKDTNDNLILGSPSGRVVISNPMTPLLINNLNSLLSTLDTCAVATGINAGNYVSSLKVPANSDPTILRTNLIGLASKLDNDVPPFTISTYSWSAGTITFTVTSDPRTIISARDPITVSGLTAATMPTSANGNFTVTSVTATTIVCALAIDPTAFSAAAGAGLKRTKYTSIAQPVALDTIPHTDQLVGIEVNSVITQQGLQTYFDAIVDTLKLEPVGIVTDPTIFYNSNSTQSSTVSLTFPIPQGVTTAHFYQLYRTVLTRPANTTSLSDDGSGNPYDPGDECKLAYEANPTNTDLTAKTITIHDITPDTFLGANLYTNPNSGEGIAQSNDVPPLAKDVTAFKGYTFYSNTSTKQRLNLAMLSVSKFTSGTSSITITSGTTSNTYTFVMGLAKTQTITTVADVGGNLNSTYFTIYNANNKTGYYYYFTNGTGVDPAPVGLTLGGSISFTNDATADTIASLIQVVVNRNSDFTASVVANVVTITNTSVGITTTASSGAVLPGFTYAVVVEGQGEDASTNKIIYTPAASGIITEVTVAGPTVIKSAAHGLTTGQIVQISNSDSTPSIDGNYAVTATDTNHFTIPVTVSGAGIFGNWSISPVYTPAQQITETSESLIRVMNKNGAEIVYPYNLSGPTDIPGKMILESRLVAQPTYSIVANSVDTGSQFDPILPTATQVASNTLQPVTSTNEVCPNRIFYSKYQQPEAVPLLNYIDVGPKDKQILRILSLRDNLFILKEEGIYRLSGLTTPFSVYPFDFSTILKAPDSAVVLNNLIYMMSNQGVATVSDTGVAIISRPIEDEIIGLISFSSFSTATFGVSYESDRAYYLFTPTTITDTHNTQCFRFNTFTNTWTMLDLEKRCGLVNSSDDLLYLGATDTNSLEQERKLFSRTDYADREHSITLGANSVNGTIITLPSVANLSVGDVITQVQYLTINNYNQLLNKLNGDSILAPHDYNTLAASAGNNMSTKLDALITKVANDIGRIAVVGATAAADYTALSPVGATFTAQQNAYNALVTLLNNDAGVGSHNYLQISGTVSYEFIIQSVSTSSVSILAPYSYPLIEGPMTVYNHFTKDLQFVPQYLTDVSVTKHVSEGTFIFEDSSFTSGTILYSSDLSANFESQTVNGNGNGIFGNNVFGNGIFGGNGTGIPFRTLIPKEKQRCRYLNCRFQHSIAREVFSLYGISLTFNPMSQRGWR